MSGLKFCSICVDTPMMSHVVTPAARPLPSRLGAFLRSDSAKRGMRYAAVSGIAIAVSMVAFAVSYRMLHLSAGWAQTVAVVLSTIPSYYLNRAWVWGRGGRSHFMKEVLPFWAISLLQFVISVVVVNYAEGHVTTAFAGKTAQTLALTAVNLLTYGVMWVAKFVLFNKVLFASKD
jgi:putative flippase GtrA